MKDPRSQAIAANYMGAIAHLLGGGPGRHAEFIDKVEVLLSGNQPHAMHLMQLRDRARSSGRPVLWFWHGENETVPQIGLVADVGGRTHIVENCMLWMGPKDVRARLVPDNFQMGAFVFDEELRLKHLKRCPARNLRAAEPDMARAYLRLREIEQDQRERGEAFAIPQLASMKEAA